MTAMVPSTVKGDTCWRSRTCTFGFSWTFTCSFSRCRGISPAWRSSRSRTAQSRSYARLPQIWTDYKRDELANIYKGKGTQKEKESVYEILFSINAAQSNAWNKIKQ